jgi:NAD(P)-dependent dehydrogenase (short-subunit alcohol dehydrogenase family)
MRESKTSMDYDGKMVVVTGAARGIGKAIVEHFLRHGANVLIADVDPLVAGETAAALRQTYPDRRIEFFQVNTKKQGECFAMANYAVEKLGTIDVQVNCAGIVSQRESLDVTEEDWNNLISINLSGVFFCCQAAGRVMKDHGGGAIINLSSIGAEAALPKRASYSSAKAGITLMTRTLAIEWAEYGIRVNAIGPAWVATDILKLSIERGVVDPGKLENAIPLGRIATLEDVAEAALFLASDKAGFITGQTLMVDGGYIIGAPHAAITYAPSKSTG